MTYTVRAEVSRTVIAQDGVDRFAFNDDGSFELLTPASGTPSDNKVPTAGQLGFGKMYESPEQTITLGGLLTLDHGLGVIPKLVNEVVVCKVAEGGYSVGDVVPSALQLAYTDAAAVVSDTATLTNTQILVRIQNVSGYYRLPNKSTGAVFNITPANWRLIVRAWA